MKGTKLLGFDFRDANQRVTDLHLVSFAKLLGWKLIPAGVGRKFVNMALANLLSVDEGSVFASQVPDFERGRIDLKHAVMPGYVHVHGIPWDSNFAIVRAAHDRSSGILKDQILFLVGSLRDCEFDFA
jgi:hypothetical protein